MSNHPPQLDAAEKAEALDTARKIVKAMPEADVKVAAVTGVIGVLVTGVAKKVVPVIDSAMALHDMLTIHPKASPQYVQALDDRISVVLKGIADRIGMDEFAGIAHNVNMWEIGRSYDVAMALAQSLAIALQPDEAGRGRWLSAAGIVKADLEALGKGVKSQQKEPDDMTTLPPPPIANTTLTPPPPYSAPPSTPPAATAPPTAPGTIAAPKKPGRPKKSAALAPDGASGATGAAVVGTPGPAPAAYDLSSMLSLAPAAAPPTGNPATPKKTAASPADLGPAMQAFGAGASSELGKLAEEWGVGRQTVSNWLNGKSAPKVKGNEDMLRRMRADIEVRIGNLRAAAEAIDAALAS